MGSAGNRTANRGVGLRKPVAGWSAAVCNANADKLESYDLDALMADPDILLVSASLTVGTCPSTPQAWQKLNHWLLMTLRRSKDAPLTGYHGVFEFQRPRGIDQARNTAQRIKIEALGGVPHGHWLFAINISVLRAQGVSIRQIGARVGFEIEEIWCRLSQSMGFGSESQSQHTSPVYEADGWQSYMLDHAGRGGKDEQRQKSRIPAAWEGKTGRLYLSGGDMRLAVEVKEEHDSKFMIWFRRRERWKRRQLAQEELATAKALWVTHETLYLVSADPKKKSFQVNKQLSNRLKRARRGVSFARSLDQPRKLSAEIMARFVNKGFTDRGAMHRECARCFGRRTRLTWDQVDEVNAWVRTRLDLAESESMDAVERHLKLVSKP